MTSICEQCFHNYVCGKYNADRDFPRYSCAYSNNHFVPIDKVKIIGKRNESKIKKRYSMEKKNSSPYTAKQVAEYILYVHHLEHTAIQNLRLQYMLYAAWLEYYLQTGNSLFSEEFYAWQYGACCAEVYYEYCSYGGIDIETRNCVDTGEIADEDARILRRIIQGYMNLQTKELCDWVRSDGSPWHEIYIKEHAPKGVIPFRVIKTLGRSHFAEKAV